MPLTEIQCRLFADECIAMADTAQREDVGALQKMAETWLQLAEQLLTQSANPDQNAPSKTEKQFT